MKCPRCSARLTKIGTDEGIKVNYRQSYSGTWHDKGILDEFSRLSGLPELLQEKPVFSHSSDRRCPRCEVPMEKSGFGAVKFQVERCRSCQGLWLDHGEKPKLSAAEKAKLDEIVARVRALAGRTAGTTDPPWAPWAAMFLLLAMAGWLSFRAVLEKVFLVRLILALLLLLVPAILGWILWRAWKTGELLLPLFLGPVVVKKIDEPVRFWVDFLLCVFLLPVFVVVCIFGVMCVWLDC